MDFKKLLQQWALLIVGVFLASHMIGGIHYDSAGALVAVVLILSFLNVMLRPLLILFALPFVVLTLGFGILIINAVLFLLVDKLVPGFYVDSFGSAFWGALVVSFVGFIANLLLGAKNVKVEVNTMNMSSQMGQSQQVRRQSLKDDDVIDV